MTILIGDGTDGLSSLGGPDGPPELAAIDNLHLPQFYPAALPVGDKHADALFIMDPADEQTVLAQGGMLHGDPLTYNDPAGPRAVLAAGRFRRSVAYAGAAGKGVYAVPLEGLFPVDEWSFVVAVNPGGSDATALGSNWTIFNAKASIQTITLSQSGTTVTLKIERDDRPGGALNTISAAMTIAVGDIPASIWTVLYGTWKKSIANGLRVALGSNAKSGVSVNSANLSWWNRPLHHDPRLSAGSGLFIAHDRYSGGTEPAGVAVSDLLIHRYHRTFGQQDFRPKPGITIDASSPGAAWPDTLTGLVGHYTKWDRAEAVEEAADPGAVIRSAQIQLAADAGCKHIRVAEFNERSIPTIVGGVVQSVDITGLIAHWSRFLDQGMTLSTHLGYMPAAMGGGTGSAAYVKPDPATIGVATQAEANAQFARYCSMTYTAAKAYFDGLHGAGWLAARIKNISFWNEPENQFSDPDSDLVDMWAACAALFETDHPDLPPVGGTDGNVDPGILARAVADGLPLGSWHVHLYQPMSLTSHIASVEGQRAALDADGFAATKVQMTEWGMISSATSGGTTGQALVSQENPQRQQSAWMGAYAFAMIRELHARGVTIGAFFRLGQSGNFSATAQSEEMMGVMSPHATPRPWPVFAAFQLMWKLSGNVITTSATFEHLRAIATKTAGGVITAVYGSLKGHNRRDVQQIQLAWAGLPAAFTWKQWRVDYRDEQDGRPFLVDQGDETDLPISADLTGDGVGCIQITPA